MHCHQTSKTGAITSSFLIVIISISLLLFIISAADLAQARYLPTRADESNVEALKDLIRGLILQSNIEQLDSKLARFHQVNRLGAAQSPQIERRSMEIPLGTAGDNLIRMSAAHSSSMD